MVSYQIDINSSSFIVNLIIKPHNTNSYLRVSPPNIINITTPRLLSSSDCYNMIKKHYKKLLKLFSNMNSSNLELNNYIHFFGSKYEVVIEQSIDNKLIIKDNTIYIYAINNEKITIKNIIYKFYKEKLSEYVLNNIDEIKKIWNISEFIKIEYKDVKTYFGECFYKRNKIILSLKLAKYEPKYIYNVLSHEMAHFYIHNHQKEFYELLEKKVPGYKNTQRELKKLKFNDIY